MSLITFVLLLFLFKSIFYKKLAATIQTVTAELVLALLLFVTQGHLHVDHHRWLVFMVTLQKKKLK